MSISEESVISDLATSILAALAIAIVAGNAELSGKGSVEGSDDMCVMENSVWTNFPDPFKWNTKAYSKRDIIASVCCGVKSDG